MYILYTPANLRPIFWGRPALCMAINHLLSLKSIYLLKFNFSRIDITLVTYSIRSSSESRLLPSLRFWYAGHHKTWLCVKIEYGIYFKHIDASSKTHFLFLIMALVACGGYGRGELHPASDVDILILLQRSPNKEAKTFIEHFIRFLWDIGLEVGHSVRSIKECISESRNDITVATNLMESRHLQGDPDLTKMMLEKKMSVKMVLEKMSVKMVLERF